MDAVRLVAVALLVVAPVSLFAPLAYITYSAPPLVIVTETEWSQNGYIYYTNHAEIRVDGGATFPVEEGQQFGCTAPPTVSSPFGVANYTCFQGFSDGPHPPPAWSVVVQAPPDAYTGPLVVYIP